MEPLYRLEHIEYAYSGRPAVKIDSLELPGEELLCIRGANGAGKSTLLQLLSLISKPTSGQLWFDGVPVPNRGRARQELLRSITLVHQEPLMLRGNVAQNLDLGLKLRGISKRERQEQIAWALEAVGLDGYQMRSARELSGGETRRVALARALAIHPRVLLLDEPFAGLDNFQARSFESLLGRLRSRGQTIILTTHDSELAARLNAPTVTLKSGKPDSYVQPMEKSLCLHHLKTHEA